MTPPPTPPTPPTARGPRARRHGLGATLFLWGMLAACAGTPTAGPEPIVFYPEPPDPPRVQFLRSVSHDSDIEVGPSGLDSLLFGERTTKRGVMAPYGVAVRNGLVYVCDIQQTVVLTLDFLNRKLDYLHLTGRGRLQKPVNLDFAPDGTLYVADMGRRQIVVVTSEGEYVDEFGPFGDESRPTDVVVAGDQLYVVDSAARCVRVLNRADGTEQRLIGTEEDEQTPRPRTPTNVALDSAGRLYVVDSVNCQVFVYEPDGTFVRTIGSAGDTVGEFARPKGIAIDQDRLFVVDAAFENCQILTNEGEPLLFFGGGGDRPGSMYLPAGVWVGREGLELFQDRLDDDFAAEALIIVTNQFGSRKVNFYALGESRKTAQRAQETDSEATTGG